MILGYFFLGLLPAQYVVRAVGFVAGICFWHVMPVLAAIPPSERDRWAVSLRNTLIELMCFRYARIPSPLWIVPTDTEYAMELISQRVARGLPVKPKRRRHRFGHKSTGSGGDSAGSIHTSEHGGEHGASSSIDWNKWGDRITETKERASELKQIFRDGQVCSFRRRLRCRCLSDGRLVYGSGNSPTAGRRSTRSPPRSPRPNTAPSRASRPRVRRSNAGGWMFEAHR